MWHHFSSRQSVTELSTKDENMEENVIEIEMSVVTKDDPIVYFVSAEIKYFNRWVFRKKNKFKNLPCPFVALKKFVMGDSLEKEREDNAVMNFAFRSKTLHLTSKFVIRLGLQETFC